MWQGMNAENGTAIDDIDHLRQSIMKILLTPIGTRVMRREFGSILPDLVDAPINARTRLLLMAATATAIVKWERRIRPLSVRMWMGGEGSEEGGRPEALTVELSGVLRDGPNAGGRVDLSLPLR